ncbi:putative acetate--CoA ligase [Gordonia araii NBRC 100433]|uniref:Putative acetate--CoA ligase n=1 Tax=Gordonia araii NBRC 100433 TaxID=1073574 RepID=G7H0H3_9ACTN|nr:GNAT family N-acetyltransferase [Gordonia araii]NNG96889.1 GNAT family N-acetyltransferase [Gordonia araii NBRC 100433]GAB09348.1 putative acetate--CoA ligase [Gordonia araii NBRC 100433]
MTEATEPSTEGTNSAGTTEGRARWEYPREWAADVLASDGGVVHLRPIVPDDADDVVAFHSRLSERTRYMRYFGPTPVLPPREVARVTTVDYRDRVALVALLGGKIIAIGVYEGLAAAGRPESAEVAFVVDDAHQGRGLGPILLEHLAGAAAENGFTRFEAEVLAENTNMVTVFRDAGYQLSRSFDGSNVHVEFLIDPTEALLSVRNARERASEARSVANLLRPESVAVIGASSDRRKVGNVLLANIISAGFTGPVYPVNGPGAGGERAPASSADTEDGVRRPSSVLGIRAYPTVRDIPDPVDLAVVAVPAAVVDEVLDDCLAKGVKTLVVVSAGFAESGEAGKESQRRLVAAVREHGMRLVGPNALGVANNDPSVSLNATLAPRIPEPGRVGFFCQSGTLGIAILDTAARRQLGLSTFVSAGNRADVSGNDVLQYWDTDDATDVVLLYLESFGNPRKFSRIARRVSREKPIIAVKTPVGPDDDRVARMVLEQAGVIQVETISELFDAAALLAYQPLPAGPRTAVVGNSSALGALAATVGAGLGLDVVDSVDVGPAASASEFGAAVAAAADNDDCDAIIAVFVPPVAVKADEYAAALLAATIGSAKPVVSTFLGDEGLLPGLSVHGEDGAPVRGSIPSYRSPERAATALAHAWRYRAWRERPDSATTRPHGTDPETVRPQIRELLAENDDEVVTLSPSVSAGLLKHYGIDVVPFAEVRSIHEASAAARHLGFPVAVKAISPRWRGRADREGARLDLPDATSVITAFGELSELTGDDVLHVQRMAPKGVATMLRAFTHPRFGAVISFGMAGHTFELLEDAAYRALPLTDLDARDLVAAPRSAALLTGYQGQQPADTDALADLLMRVSFLVEDIPEVREVLCDQILASTDRASVLNAQITIGPVSKGMDTGPRRLGD